MPALFMWMCRVTVGEEQGATIARTPPSASRSSYPTNTLVRPLSSRPSVFLPPCLAQPTKKAALLHGPMTPDTEIYADFGCAAICDTLLSLRHFLGTGIIKKFA